jgi:RND family efflux transporter MFP subunit
MRFSLRVILSVGISASICLALSGCGKETTPATEKKAGKDESLHTLEVETIAVQSENLKRQIRIPSDLAAFKEVEIYPKVQGFIKAMYVDRGSAVKKGQVLVEVIAPELEANFREAEAKYEAARSSLSESESKIASLVAQKEEAEARLQANEANYKRIQIAAQTPGAIAPVDIETAEKKVAGDKAKVRSAEQMVIAAKAALEAEKDKVRSVKQALNSVREMKAYLTIRAPFDGVISERNVHEGSLVSSSSAKPPLLKIEQISSLRLLVPVPESAITGVQNGSQMKFTVSALVGKEFTAKISRISHDLDRKTRTMIVELDVDNSHRELEPGMYAEVLWRMERPYKTLFVPAKSVISREDKAYVVQVHGQKGELVEVTRGQRMGPMVEVVGDIHPGDQVVFNPTGDEKGKVLHTKLLTAEELNELLSHHEEGHE